MPHPWIFAGLTLFVLGLAVAIRSFLTARARDDDAYDLDWFEYIP